MTFLTYAVIGGGSLVCRRNTNIMMLKATCSIGGHGENGNIEQTCMFFFAILGILAKNSIRFELKMTRERPKKLSHIT